jgi:hypothetical protein
MAAHKVADTTVHRRAIMAVASPRVITAVNRRVVSRMEHPRDSPMALPTVDTALRRVDTVAATITVTRPRELRTM